MGPKARGDRVGVISNRAAQHFQHDCLGSAPIVDIRALEGGIQVSGRRGGFGQPNGYLCQR